MLDITDRQIVIIGGGSVAARKATGLIAVGATKIRVVAPGFPGEFSTAVDKQIKRYEADDLKDAHLVFAATDSATINGQIVRDAQAAGIWVNRADGSEELPGDFTTPAKFEAGSITVTVSTGSPALAATVRDGILDRFDPAWTTMADAMQTLRPEIKTSISDPARRAALFRALATREAIDILREKGIDGLKEWMLQH